MSKLYEIACRLTRYIRRNKTSLIKWLIGMCLVAFCAEILELSTGPAFLFGGISYVLMIEFVDWFLETPRSDEGSK